MLKQRNRLYKNCKELYDNGFQETGIYVISLDGQHLLDVYCDQDIDGGGWTVGSVMVIKATIMFHFHTIFVRNMNICNII